MKVKNWLEKKVSFALINMKLWSIEILENTELVLGHQKYKKSNLYDDIIDYLKEVPLSLKDLL